MQRKVEIRCAERLLRVPTFKRAQDTRHAPFGGRGELLGLPFGKSTTESWSRIPQVGFYAASVEIPFGNGLEFEE